MLFEVAVIELPKKTKEGEDPGEERLVFGPEPILAKDDQSAAMAVFLDHPESFKDADRKRLQVMIRPFA